MKSFLDEKNHPFNLERGAAAAPLVAEAPKPATTPVVEAPAPVAPASVPAANPLQEGYYEIYRLNGEPQQGVLMHIEKASDDHFLATATTAGDSGWSGELLRSGDAWELKVPDLRGRRRAPEGTPLNPGNGKNEISREGPLLTFKSGSAIFVWKKTDKTSIERAPRPESQPSSAAINGASVIGALVSGFVATQTPRPVRQPNQCVAGYVWREAGPDDRVCVTPETHDRTAIENSRAAANRYADGRCLDGYVWREAFYGDHVCVSLQSRDQAARDNGQARARVMH